MTANGIESGNTDAEIDLSSLTRNVLSSNVYLVDFDEMARQYVEKVGREANRRVSWWDLYGKHQHLASRPQYKEYKIDARVDNFRYGTVKHQIDRPVYVYAKWVDNEQSSETIEREISNTTQRSSTLTWSLQEGLKIGLSVKVTAGVPAIFGGETSSSTELSLTSTQSKTKTETETFSISETINILPKTTVKAEWTITEREMEVEWEADVIISGWIAIWFKEKYEGHWLWFHPVWYMAVGPFVGSDNDLKYRAKGAFTGVRVDESTFRIYEYPLRNRSRAEFPVVLPTVRVLEKRDVSPLVHGTGED